MKYFGILSKNDFENELINYDPFSENSADLVKTTAEDYSHDYEINKEDYINILITKFELGCLLVAKGIFDENYLNENLINFEESNLESENHLTFDDFETNISVPIYLSLEVYLSIFLLFKKEVLNLKLNFFNKFRKDIYGLSFEEAKKKALHQFKCIYDTLNINDSQKSFEIGFNENKKTYTPSYLFKLYFQRQKIVNKIKKHCYLPYLYGEIELYLEYPYKDEKVFNEILIFQINLEILLELNEEFKFEVDIYFNNIFSYKLKSIKYNDKFKNDNAFAFTLYTINKFSEIKTTDIESLFNFLVTENLYIGKVTDFMAIINDEFKTKITKIHKYETNEKHKSRVEELKNEWIYFTKKFC